MFLDKIPAGGSPILLFRITARQNKFFVLSVGDFVFINVEGIQIDIVKGFLICVCELGISEPIKKSPAGIKTIPSGGSEEKEDWLHTFTTVNNNAIKNKQTSFLMTKFLLVMQY